MHTQSDRLVGMENSADPDVTGDESSWYLQEQNYCNSSVQTFCSFNKQSVYSCVQYGKALAFHNTQDCTYMMKSKRYNP